MTADEAITRAMLEIGVKESPPDSNKVKYNTWYYGREVQGSAYPWCMTFIEWIFRSTGLIAKTASCSTLYNSMQSKGQIVKDPQPGDLCFMKFNKARNVKAEHIGIVCSVTKSGVITVEGNTSATGSQDNGGMVMQKTRAKSVIVGYGRPAYTACATSQQTEKQKQDITKVAKDVIAGKYGNGTARKNNLTRAGYDYDAVQKEVNKILKSK